MYTFDVLVEIFRNVSWVYVYYLGISVILTYYYPLGAYMEACVGRDLSRTLT